jgi:hypothetical protein
MSKLEVRLRAELLRQTVWQRRLRWNLRHLHDGRDIMQRERSMRLCAQLQRQTVRQRWLRRHLRHLR